MNENTLKFSDAIATACNLPRPAVRLLVQVAMQQDVMPADVVAAQALLSQPPPSPTGNRLALCIGINRYGGGNDLKGCVNDANDWALLTLKNLGFSCRTILDGQATKAAILNSIELAVRQLAAGDLLVLHYSGHGTQIATNDPNEPDGMDECWVPADFGRAGLIRDNDLADLFSRAASGSRIVVISDSCHSGSMTRDARGEVTERFLDPSIAGVAEVNATTRAASPTQNPHVLLLSGCMDHETSADAVFGGRYEGAFSHYARLTLSAAPNYAAWNRLTLSELRRAGYRQSPRLDGTPEMQAMKVFA